MKQQSDAVASAMHAQQVNNHVVALSALRVLLLEDSGGWFAQGLEIDYAASGATMEEVKKNFEEGFCATIHEHLTMYGSIERFLKVADKAAWDEFYQPPQNSVQQHFSCIHTSKLEQSERLPDGVLPFDTLAFLKRVNHGARL